MEHRVQRASEVVANAEDAVDPRRHLRHVLVTEGAECRPEPRHQVVVDLCRVAMLVDQPLAQTVERGVRGGESRRVDLDVERGAALTHAEYH